MSLLREYKTDEKGLFALIRDLKRILTAREEGLRWTDNIGPIATLRYDSDDAPFDVPIDAKSKPLAVVCLAAVRRDDPAQIQSFARVTWEYVSGKVRVHSISLATVSVTYDVTLGILMG